jgi:hypothetical protein
MNWMQRYAGLVELYGIPDSIYAKIEPVLVEMAKLIVGDKIEELIDRFEGFEMGGDIVSEATRPIPPELSKKLSEGGYSWRLTAEKRAKEKIYHTFFYPHYDPPTKTAVFLCDIAEARAMRNSAFVSDSEEWRYWDVATGMLMRYDKIVVHEIAHLMRFAVSEIPGSGPRRDAWQYRERGHHEDPLEIDAIIHELAWLRDRLGQEAYDKLPLDQIKTKFPEDVPTLARWVKRLMREDLLTSEMRRKWNL